MELMQMLEANEDKGYLPVGDIRRGPDYERKFRETLNLLSNANGHAPHKWEYLIREALTTTDFPYLFGDVLDRQVLAQYQATPTLWKSYVKTSTVPRIFPQVGGYRFAISGGDQRLSKVGEKGEYLASNRNEERFPLSVYKYGQQFDISWETIINDDLDALKDTPMRFAKSAQRTE